jgi:hypothetical protein
MFLSRLVFDFQGKEEDFWPGDGIETAQSIFANCSDTPQKEKTSELLEVLLISGRFSGQIGTVCLCAPLQALSRSIQSMW